MSELVKRVTRDLVIDGSPIRTSRLVAKLVELERRGKFKGSKNNLVSITQYYEQLLSGQNVDDSYIGILLSGRARGPMAGA